MLQKDFLSKMETIYPKLAKEYAKIFRKKPVSFRVNTLKSSNEEVEKIFTDLGIVFEKVPFLTNGYTLPHTQEKDIWHLPFVTDGKIYLQGIASQIVGEILRDILKKPQQKILDLCAAPGGKTSHICTLSHNKHHEIYAAEPKKIRREKLEFTLVRQGCHEVQILNQSAQEFAKDEKFQEYFDVILVDAPCSSEGKIDLSRPKSFSNQLASTNKKYYNIQKEITAAAVPLLAPDGILLYTTCTLDVLENEGIVHFLVSNFPQLSVQDIPFFQNIPSALCMPGLSSFGKYIFQKDVKKSIRLLPSPEMEGFFYAQLHKK